MVSAVCFSLCVSFAFAQNGPEASDPSSTEPAESRETRVDPETGERYIEISPEEPLAQGPYRVEPWIVWSLAGLVLVAGVAGIGTRLRKR